MEVYVTRQPIFDREDRVAGYELLYRSHRASVSAPRHVLPTMSSRVIVDAFLGIGLDRVTDGLPAYINCTRELLLSGTLELLDPSRVVLEVLESVEPDTQVIDTCERLVAAGYRLALDDFVFGGAWEPLLRIADVVKIDVLGRDADELERQIDRIRGYNAYLLAEKVEYAEVRDLCMRLGFDLFQGYHFSRPEIFSRRDLSVGQLQLLRLINLLRDLDSSDAALEQAFRADVSLSYKLLRMANAAAVANMGIRSIGHAIRLLGRQSLYRWALLLLISSAPMKSGVDSERLQSQLIRARFGELIGESAGDNANAGSLFLVGLFSRLDVLLGVTMEELLLHVVLSPEVREALLSRSGPLAPALELVDAYEAGRWDEVEAGTRRLGLAPGELPELYVRALTWSRSQIRLAG